jgi:hypothetical protein
MFYNSTAVEIYNPTSSLVRFEMVSPSLKNALAYYSAGPVVVKSEVVGLAPVFSNEYPFLADLEFKWNLRLHQTPIAS